MSTPVTAFQVWADFGFVGTANHGDFSVSFDDVVDQYVEARRNGYDAIVWRLDTPQAGQAGMMSDVTDHADDLVRQWHDGRGDEYPEWLADVPSIAAE